jgi:hypothetical protein
MMRACHAIEPAGWPDRSCDNRWRPVGGTRPPPSGTLDRSGGAQGETGAGASAGMALERNAAIASSRRRRWPIGTTPISLRSSVVSLGKTWASKAFSWNAALPQSRTRSDRNASGQFLLPALIIPTHC